jgi:hypothetical protein
VTCHAKAAARLRLWYRQGYPIVLAMKQDDGWVWMLNGDEGMM